MVFWEDNGPASWYSQVTAWHIYLSWNEKELLQNKWPKILSCKVVFSKGPLNTRQAWVSLITSQTIVSAATAKPSYSLGLCPHSPPSSSRYPRHSHLSVTTFVAFSQPTRLLLSFTWLHTLVSSSLFLPSPYHFSPSPLLTYFRIFTQFLFFSTVLFCFSSPSRSLGRWSKDIFWER